jgi:hypothetical protein
MNERWYISSKSNENEEKRNIYSSLLLLFFYRSTSFFFQLNRKINVGKIICNSILCPAIQTRVCNRHIIEAWTAFVMWSSNVCYLFFSIKIPFITYVWLLSNTHIWNKRMKSQNPDCLNISKGTEGKEKTLMIYYSSFIYTTGIDCIGRMLMIVRSFFFRWLVLINCSV